MARQRRKNTVKLANHEQQAKVEKISSLIARNLRRYEYDGKTRRKKPFENRHFIVHICLQA